MKYFYAALSLLAILFGVILLVSAKSAIHEIEAFIIFLIAAVLMVCSEICEVSAELRHARKKNEAKSPAAKFDSDTGAVI